MTPRTLLLTPLVVVSACGGDGATLRGILRPDALAGSDTIHIVAGDGAERVEVREGAFEIAGVEPGTLALRFVRGGDTARMEIGGLPEEGEVELRGIRVDQGSGLAFPSVVAVPGGGLLTVNGLRYGGTLPERVAADGTVLAASDDADAFLVRPADTRLPDLRVVVGPLTEGMTVDGDPAPLGAIEAGDSVRVEGTIERGYVVASRITGPRRLALREARVQAEQRERRDDDPPPEPVRDDDPAPRTEVRSGDADEGSGGNAPRAERGGGEPAAAAEPERGRGRGKGRGEERGRGKGGGKKGKG